MTFAPKFHTTLQPDFILKLLWRSSFTNKRRVAIGLHEVFQCRFTCRQISTHCFSFSFNQIHFFHTHQRPIRSISRVPKHTLISTELSIYIWFKTEILNTMQTPALFALKNNIVEGAAKKRMIERLRRNFKEHGNCLQTGFLGTSILMSTLTENGMADMAYELLLQRKNPSWLYSVDNGATTIWERWNSYMKDSGMGPQGMNSFNHYAYGCVCEWLWETAAGIAADPARPGFRHIIMRPVPDRRLGHLTAEYRSAAGLIKSSWRYDGDIWKWTFTIPEGATASVTLPGDTAAKEYGAGTHTLSVRM